VFQRTSPRRHGNVPSFRFIPCSAHFIFGLAARYPPSHPVPLFSLFLTLLSLSLCFFYTFFIRRTVSRRFSTRDESRGRVRHKARGGRAPRDVLGKNDLVRTFRFGGIAFGGVVTGIEPRVRLGYEGTGPSILPDFKLAQSPPSPRAFPTADSRRNAAAKPKSGIEIGASSSTIRPLAIRINQPARRQLPALMMNVRYKRNVMRSACTTRPDTRACLRQVDPGSLGDGPTDHT